MNLRRFLILFLLFLWSFSANAQEVEEISIQPLDTTKVTIDPLSPSKAAFYSAVVPGLGQIYNKKYWKLPIVYGGLAAGIFFYSWNNKKYHEYRDEYKKGGLGIFIMKSLVDSVDYQITNNGRIKNILTLTKQLS